MIVVRNLKEELESLLDSTTDREAGRVELASRKEKALQDFREFCDLVEYEF